MRDGWKSHLPRQMDYFGLINGISLQRKDEGHDQLCLAVYDRRSANHTVRIAHLHGHNKAADLTQDLLKGAYYPFPETTRLNRNILFVFLALIAVHLINALLSKRDKRIC